MKIESRNQEDEEEEGRKAMLRWNAFKLCTALRALGYIMVLVVAAIVALTYYAVVVSNYLPALFAGGIHALIALPLLILFHFLLVMLLWSYFNVLVTDAGDVPPNWRPNVDEEAGPLVESDGLVSDQSVTPFDPANQNVRFCRKCNHFKPPRCHHCSVCGRCILKMDHHCVWVVNCVGALNYKYFLLFLFYTFLETTLVTLSLLRYFMAFFTDQEITGTLGTVAASFITFVLNLAFSLSVLGFMMLHLSLVASNKTTIEAYEKKNASKWHYDLGRKKNFEQVFGTDKWYWFIPAYSDEDLRRMPALQGIDYPTRPDLHALQQL